MKQLKMIIKCFILNNNNCNSSGEPLIIQTNIEQSQLKGLKRDLKPKVIINPNGKEQTKVIPNSFRVVKKPNPKLINTSVKFI